MTHCYNCGHAGTFVLLVELALAVPEPTRDRPVSDAHVADWSPARGRQPHPRRGTDRRQRGRFRSHRRGDGPTGRTDPGRPQRGEFPASSDLSFAVQCPVCDSTDVGVAAADLLARYGSTTTS